MGRWAVSDGFGRALEPARALTVLAVVFGLAQVLETAIVDDVGHRGVTLVFAVLAPAALAVAWRAPLAAVLAFGALCVADAALGGRLLSASEAAVFICIAGMLVLGIRADTRTFALGALATVALLTTASLLEGDSGDLLSGIAWVCIVPVGIPGLLGRVLRSRNDLNRRLDEQARELERNRAEREQAAVLAERTRIARELQDVVAHDVSVMLVQAAAAKRTVPVDPERARRAIAAVEETGREALGELRRLLGVLRRGDEELGARAPAVAGAHRRAGGAHARRGPARRARGGRRPGPAAARRRRRRLSHRPGRAGRRHAPRRRHAGRGARRLRAGRGRAAGHR